MIEQIFSKFLFLYVFLNVKAVTKLYIETPLLLDYMGPHCFRPFNYKNKVISRNTPFSTVTL